MASLRPLIAITGTTGTGKSQLAVQIAREFDGEVINADALQLYKGLPIVTNKISGEEMRGIRHHLLGNVGIDEDPWTIGKFVTEAESVIADIHFRGKLPIVVGGTHYYVQSLLLRNNILVEPLEEETNVTAKNTRWPILEASAEEMMEQLQKIDPEAAAWWHPRDQRKIRRSLEICLNSGRKVSDIYHQQRFPDSSKGFPYQERYDSLCFHLHADRPALIERLNARVDQMMDRGLLDEVQLMRTEKARLDQAGKVIDESKGIWVAIGYKEFAPYFERVEALIGPDEYPSKQKADGCERTKISTRQYAKRQVQWVRNKLLPAIEAAGCQSRFFVLDATTSDAWAVAVAGPAFSILSKFLDKAELPDPAAIGRTEQIFAGVNKAVRVNNMCEICQVTTVTKDTWEAHLRSAKHKAQIRQMRNNEEGRVSGRD